MTKEEKSLLKAIAVSKAAIAQHKANLRFARLPEAKMRVAIAEDVLAVIAMPPSKRPRFSSSYIDLGGASGTQKQLCTDLSGCTVCGIGSLMLAHLRMFDDVPDRNHLDNNGFNDIAERLKGCFSRHQLGLIEAAFEGEAALNLMDDYDVDDDTHDAIRKWGEFSDSKSRAKCLREIMLNIIRNKGTFEISQLPGTRKKAA